MGGKDDRKGIEKRRERGVDITNHVIKAYVFFRWTTARDSG